MQHWCTRVAGALPRARFAPVFRIEERREPASPAALMAELRNVFAAAAAAPPVTASTPADDPGPLLASLGTNLWRLRSRMLEPGGGQPRDEFRRLYRHVEALWDTLGGAGLKIVDHTDAPFDPGLSLKVISFEPQAGLARETVIETLRPTIFLRDRRIQIGEVIVGKPGGPELAG
jgi:hypothetical protein